MKVYLIIGLIVTCFNFVYGQDVIQLQNKIDSLQEESDSVYVEIVDYATEQKKLVELQYYEILYSKYKLFPERDDRIQLLRLISDIPWYNYHERKSSTISRGIYLSSLIYLIKECENDLQQLERIYVYPAYHVDVYPTLKAAIIRAGGKWTKGEIPIRQRIDGNLIPEKSSN